MLLSSGETSHLCVLCLGDIWFWNSFSPLFSFQDGKIHLYSIQGNTLKDEGRTVEVNGSITDMAYSNDGAYLAVLDDKKVATAFSVADNYSVNICLSCTFFLGITPYPVPINSWKVCIIVVWIRVSVSFYNSHCFFFFPPTRSKMSFMDTMPNQWPWPGHLIMSTLQLVGWTWWCLSGQLVMQIRGLSSQVGRTDAHVLSLMFALHADVHWCTWRMFCTSNLSPLLTPLYL